jgi:hypothetical protein
MPATGPPGGPQQVVKGDHPLAEVAVPLHAPAPGDLRSRRRRGRETRAEQRIRSYALVITINSWSFFMDFYRSRGIIPYETRASMRYLIGGPHDHERNRVHHLESSYV